MAPPDNELPAVVPLRAVLARTDAVAIVVIGARVYRVGVQFDLIVRARDGGLDLSEIVLGVRHPGTFLVGVEFPYGSWRAAPISVSPRRA